MKGGVLAVVSGSSTSDPAIASGPNGDWCANTASAAAMACAATDCIDPGVSAFVATIARMRSSIGFRPGVAPRSKACGVTMAG